MPPRAELSSHAEELAAIVEALERQRGFHSEALRLPAVLRQVAADLALARHRMRSEQTCEQLADLVIRGQRILQAGTGAMEHNGFLRFVQATFPQAVRRDWRLVLVGLLLFFVPFIAMILSSNSGTRWINSSLSVEEISSLEGMYGDGAQAVEQHQREDGVLTGSFMGFAFYVNHNITIGLRSYALGILATVGSVYELAWEGVKLGAMFGYVHHTGNGHKIWQFAISHSSFELLGLILCGVAGIRLGLGLLLPGQMPRLQSIKHSARLSLPLLLGGAGMVFLAAIVEGFWSPQSFIPVGLKFAFGISMWVLWFLYFLLAGRGAAVERISHD